MAPINSKNDVANMATLAELALQIAQSQIGQSEKPIGSNSGPMVNEYLKAVGLPPGYAWCQAFVYWCYAVAAKEQNKPNPVIRTASVHDCWSHIATQATMTKLLKEDALKQPELVQPGDQFILSFGGNAGHTGLVESVEGTIIHTIEGNSNTNGSREGYEVVRHQRNINDKALQGFIKYS
jgi:hypothetical protein